VALTIVNEEVERLAQELGSQTGEPIPQLILTALQERASWLQGQRSEARLGQCVPRWLIVQRQGLVTLTSRVPVQSVASRALR
jgi:hypothetical protein